MWLSQTSRNTKLKASQSSEDAIRCFGVSSKYEVKGCPLARYKHAICATSNGCIYMHGGRIDNMSLDDDLWRYDIKDSNWSQINTHGKKPPTLQEHTLVEYDEQLYLFGGQVSASDNDKSFWRLDLKTNEWSILGMESSSKFSNRYSLSNRRGHTALVYKDCMYIYGGYEDFRGSSGQLWEYQLLAQRWELCDLRATTAYKPKARHSHSAIIYKDSMYIYGGLSNLKPLADLWRWSWTEKRWFKERTRGRSPGHLYGHSAVQAFGSMFVFGGEQKGRKSCNLWRLNLSNLKWHKIRPKGSCPSASVWHKAIANPLNMLDQFNYIVESNSSYQENDVFSCSQLPQDQILENHPPSTETSQQVTSYDNNDLDQSYNTDMRSQDSENLFENLEIDINRMFKKTFTPIPEQDTHNLVRESLSTDVDVKEDENNDKIVRKSYTSATPLRYSGISYHSTRPVGKLTTSFSEIQNIHRPKSEIVQSLIERADNRIKHLYTPYFNNQQQTELKRCSLYEKPVRQKLAKTMTQYSLFFEDEAADGQENENLKRNKFTTTFREICKEAMQLEEHKTPSMVQSSSELSLDALNSGSKTLCEPMNSIGQILCSLDSRNGNFSETKADFSMTGQGRLIEITDNTSLTLSILAEFEEDDILHYSASPTNGSIKSTSSARQIEQHLSNTANFSNKLTSTSAYFNNKTDLTSNLNEKQSIQVRERLDEEQDCQRIEMEYQDKNLEVPINSVSSGYESNIVFDRSHDLGVNRVELVANESDSGFNLSSSILSSQRLATFSSQTVTSFQRKSIQRSSSFAKRRLLEFFSSKRDKNNDKTTTRYRQLCMLVFGGKQDSNISLCNGPVSVWRLYI